MNMCETRLIVLSISICLTTMSQASADDAPQPFQTQLQIHSKGPTGPYNIRASVQPTLPPTVKPMADSIAPARSGQSAQADKSKGLTEEQRKQMFNEFLERFITGEAPNDVGIGDPLTTGFINQAVDMGIMQEDQRRRQEQGQNQQQNQIGNSEAHHHNTRGRDPEAHHQTGPGKNPEDHHHVPTDGSPNSEAITTQAIETFYNGLPSDVTNRLSGLGVDPLATVHGAGDPYAPYAMALQRGDFSRMRQIANSDDIDDWNQRIAMLGLAGATALRNLSNPNGSNAFAAKDALRKIAEDLHYAGQGLGSDNPNDAKLKATCEDISRIWSNMTNQGQKPSSQ